MITCELQMVKQLFNRGRRVGAIFTGFGQALAVNQLQCAFVTQATQPGKSRRCATEFGFGTSIRVVAQPGARALCLGDPYQIIAIYNAQPHEFTGQAGEAIKYRFGEVDYVALGQVLKCKRDYFEGKNIIAVLMVLAHKTLFDQAIKHAVSSARRNVQGFSYLLKG